MQVSLIAATAWTGVIGRDGDLPWRLPADLVRFKQTTMGHHLLMGRRTWQSINRPLPGRKILVVSASGFEVEPAGSESDGSVTVVDNLEKAVSLAREAGEDELMVGGGARVYEQMIPEADRLYLTRIDGSFAGDAYFPWIDPASWQLKSEEFRPPDAANAYPLRFQVWGRK